MDIIIPTLLLTDCDVFSYMLEQANSSPYVEKIIIIDNTVDASFKRVYSQLLNDRYTIVENSKNILVNPSWNKGMEIVESEHYLILNDDILCHESILSLCEKKLYDDLSIGLLTVRTIDPMSPLGYESIYQNEVDQEDSPLWGDAGFTGLNQNPGWFMCGRTSEWVYIPEDIKVFYGDNFIYSTIRNSGKKILRLDSHPISHHASSTIDKLVGHDEAVENAIAQDHANWSDMKTSWGMAGDEDSMIWVFD